MSQQLFYALDQRVKERRNIPLATAVCYLNGSYKFGDKTRLSYCSKEECHNFIELHHARLFRARNNVEVEDILVEHVTSQYEDHQKEFQSYLNLKKAESSTSQILKALNIFEIQGVLNYDLSLIKNALESIQPSSVLSERAFLTAGNFLRKRRSRIGDELLDALMILSNDI